MPRQQGQCPAHRCGANGGEILEEKSPFCSSPASSGRTERGAKGRDLMRLNNPEHGLSLETELDFAKKPASSALPQEHLDLGPAKCSMGWELCRAQGAAVLAEGMRGKPSPHDAACSIPKVK